METALSDHSTGFDRNVVMVVAVGMVGLVACVNLLVRGFWSPLKHVPGPWHTRFSRLRLKTARLTGRRLHYVHSLHEKYGSIVRVAPNETSCVDLQSVALVYKIGGGFDKAQWVGDYTKRLPALSLSMIVDSDEAKERRKLLQGSFALSSLRSNWEAEIRQKVELAVAKIRSEALAGSSNTHKWWTFMAADIISKMSFGESLGLMDLGKNNTTYMRAIENALPADVFQCELPFLDHLSKLIPKSLLQTFTRRLEQVGAGGRNGVESLRRQQDKTRSLFKEMIDEYEKDGRPWLTDDAVTTEGAGMMVAGTDTTAAVLTYLIWSVLQQEGGLQKRLEEEVARLGDDFDDRRLQTCSLLGAVIEETLRMYPAVPSSLPRIIPDGGITLGSYFIPGKTVVCSPAYTLQRDPDIFAEPHKFDADRYLHPGKVSLEQRQAFIPLGAGARVCIGQHLAMMELRLATAVFFRRCRGAKLSDGMPQDSMDMVDYVLLSPKRKRCDVVLS
ncbi:putative sterigmatocystin biosynthesis P450 monooxygenase [Colletotrichum shisoi]|uniref:Putative sterigmatocystin biosynthesis P450 monooxygenase n=1 Tax=Colletotrichum shisoi TaxID=2078593 RepID=A0A5Q4BMA9_9PEZI|nr:putative sterigmatocystin biosynthesis P450 monooxygenase [Colletotrichum shisoi]